MNSLSWLIYLAQVLDGFRGLMLTMVILPIGFFLLRGAVYGISEGEAFADNWGYWTKRTAATSFIAAVLFVFTPSKQTVILIAGSQLGEMAIKSDTVQGVVNPGIDLLKAWIKEETDNLKPKPKADK